MKGIFSDASDVRAFLAGRDTKGTSSEANRLWDVFKKHWKQHLP